MQTADTENSVQQVKRDTGNKLDNSGEWLVQTGKLKKVKGVQRVKLKIFTLKKHIMR